MTVTDDLPAGLTATAWGGPGWNNCTPVQVTGPATLTCNRNDSVGPNGPAFQALTLTVNVSCGAANSVTNKATVSGSNDSAPGNNVANDQTTIQGNNHSDYLSGGDHQVHRSRPEHGHDQSGTAGGE